MAFLNKMIVGEIWKKNILKKKINKKKYPPPPC